MATAPINAIEELFDSMIAERQSEIFKKFAWKPTIIHGKMYFWEDYYVRYRFSSVNLVYFDLEREKTAKREILHAFTEREYVFYSLQGKIQNNRWVE